jgi:hypothetical protein
VLLFFHRRYILILKKLNCGWNLLPFTSNPASQLTFTNRFHKRFVSWIFVCFVILLFIDYSLFRLASLQFSTSFNLILFMEINCNRNSNFKYNCYHACLFVKDYSPFNFNFKILTVLVTCSFHHPIHHLFY